MGRELEGYCRVSGLEWGRREGSRAEGEGDEGGDGALGSAEICSGEGTGECG